MLIRLAADWSTTAAAVSSSYKFSREKNFLTLCPAAEVDGEPVALVAVALFVADHGAISGHSLEIFRDYHAENLWVAGCRSFQENWNQPLHGLKML